MHKSRLSAVVIDCFTDNLQADAEFWAGALGREAKRSTNPEDANYVKLVGPEDEIHIGQRERLVARTPVAQEVLRINNTNYLVG